SWRRPTFTRSSNSAVTTVTGDLIASGVYLSGGMKGERSLPLGSPPRVPRKIPRKSHVRGDVRERFFGHHSVTHQSRRTGREAGTKLSIGRNWGTPSTARSRPATGRFSRSGDRFRSRAGHRIRA